MAQDSSKKPSDKWYYTVFTNAKGYQYIYAYQPKISLGLLTTISPSSPMS